MITHEEIIKSVWPEWKLEKLIGRGAYGSVYQAVREEHGLTSLAAIKIIPIPQDTAEIDALRSEGMTDSEVRAYYERIMGDFTNEIRMMVSLKGAPHIVSIDDYKVLEQLEDFRWDILIRMELLVPFITYTKGNSLETDEVIRLGIELCTALEICHGQNVIHRDVKPQNIFVDRFGSFKLGDFGIARKMEGMTGGLSQKGTYNYIAPEVSHSLRYDKRADIYSVGLVLYQQVNEGRLPFLENAAMAKNPRYRTEALQRRLEGEELPMPCKADDELGEIILKACRFKPNERYNNISEMKKALQKLYLRNDAIENNKNTSEAYQYTGQTGAQIQEEYDDERTVSARVYKKQDSINSKKIIKDSISREASDRELPNKNTNVKYADPKPNNSDSMADNIDYTLNGKEKRSEDKYNKKENRLMETIRKKDHPEGGGTKRGKNLTTILTACVSIILTGSIIFGIIATRNLQKNSGNKVLEGSNTNNAEEAHTSGYQLWKETFDSKWEPVTDIKGFEEWKTFYDYAGATLLSVDNSELVIDMKKASHILHGFPLKTERGNIYRVRAKIRIEDYNAVEDDEPSGCSVFWGSTNDAFNAHSFVRDNEWTESELIFKSSTSTVDVGIVLGNKSGTCTGKAYINNFEVEEYKGDLTDLYGVIGNVMCESLRNSTDNIDSKAYTTMYFLEGSPQYHQHLNESAEKLVDANPQTKYFTETIPCEVQFKLMNPTKVNGIVFCTADDNSSYPERLPLVWTLFGVDENGERHEIHTGGRDVFGRTAFNHDYIPVRIQNKSTYDTYVFEVWDTMSGTFQMADIYLCRGIGD